VTEVEKISIDLGNVQKTLFLPLWGRAVESQKEHPELVDKTAFEIMQKVDYDFSPMTARMDDLSQIAWIRRSALMDKTIRKFLQMCPQGTVVNIGCGLDTTFDRIDNDSVLWYELDLPDVIELRSKLIPENSRRISLTTSFLETGWLDEIPVGSGVFFMAAGVFYYFEEIQIKEFLIRLAKGFPGAEIIFDASSPRGMAVANKKVIESSGLDERSHLKWGLKSVKVFSAWDKRLKVIGTYFYFRKINIRRGLRNILMGFLSDMLKIQYIVHIQIAAK
jgi:O-methyltransferase involved in polyketide biosynthesis